MEDPILTLPEVAILLEVSEKAVDTMAQTGQIPAFKVRGQWRFTRDGIERWIDEQKAAVKGNIGRNAPYV